MSNSSTDMWIAPLDGRNVRVRTNETNYAVTMDLDMTVTNSYQDYRGYKWKAVLQRLTSAGWSNVMTKEGYVAPISSSHRTFSNIAVTGNQMRIKLIFTSGVLAVDPGTSFMQTNSSSVTSTRYSASWIR